MKIKKTLAALMAAALAFSMAACSSTDEDDENEDKKEESSVYVPDDSDEPGSELSEADTEEEISEADDQEDLSGSEEITDDSEEDETVVSAQTGYSEETGVYTDSMITITADPDLWMFTGDLDNELFSCTYISDDLAESTANMNIYAGTQDLFDGLSAADYAEYCKEMYEYMDGIEISDTTEGTFNGYDSFTFELTYELDEETSMTIMQIIITNGSTLAAISYGAENSVMDELQTQFDAVLGTFDFV